VFAALAEFERDLIRERTSAGLAAALLSLPAVGYGLLALAVAGLGVWRFWFRPVLGSED